MVSQLGGMNDTLCDQIVKKIDGKLLSKHKENYNLFSTCHFIRKFPLKNFSVNPNEKLLF